ncbi:MAG: Unknown protein, partial [uncultured Sulfurovum sp.]
FEVIKGQKPGMVAPLDKADGMLVTTKELDYLEEGRLIKMIPIKLNLQSDKKEDFFTK